MVAKKWKDSPWLGKRKREASTIRTQRPLKFGFGLFFAFFPWQKEVEVQSWTCREERESAGKAALGRRMKFKPYFIEH